MAYKDYIDGLRKTWTGERVTYDGKPYIVVGVDYNGFLLINKQAKFTPTTAVGIGDVQKV